MKNKKGFTIIEVVIVLIIIGILSLVFIPELTKLKHRKTNESKNAAKMVEIRKKIAERNASKTLTKDTKWSCDETEIVFKIDGTTYYLGTKDSWGDLKTTNCDEFDL